MNLYTNKGKMIVFFLYLFLFTFLSGAFSGDRPRTGSDVNADGLPDGSVAEETLPLARRAAVSDITIGLIETGSSNDFFNRLRNIGYSNITLLPVNATLETLSQFELICLPANWANSIGGNAGEILAESEAYKQYAFNGGGLYVEQPNPYRMPGDTVRVTLLPEDVTFHTQYDTADFPPIIIDTSHVITEGLSRAEMPFPADTIPVLDPSYTVLVRGEVTDYPSLFIRDYGQGRVLVETGHSSTRAIHPMSDAIITRMVEWTAGKITSLAGEEPALPGQPLLSPNYPNPFNPQTTIRFYLPAGTEAELTVFDLLGREIVTLLKGTMTRGMHSVEWNGKNRAGETVNSGVYIYRLKTGATVLSRRMLLLK